MDELLEDVDQGVLTLTINRPAAHNTMSTAVSDALCESLERAADDQAVRCVVLTGAGQVFCAGGDVGDQASGANFDDGVTEAEADAAFVDTIRRGSRSAELLHHMPKPTLAIINGAAAGAGLSLALACDLRFCLDTAKLTTAFARIGLSPDSGLSYFLPRLVGSAKARELCFTAEVITGSQAKEIGLVSEVATAATFSEESRAYAERLATLPTVAIGYTKEGLNTAERGSLADVLDVEARNVVRSMRTDDHQRAAAAFVNKEPVRFEGR